MGNSHKKTYFFLLLTVVMLLLAFLLFKDEAVNRLKIVFEGRGDVEYYRISSSDEDDFWALGRRDDRYIFTSGKAGKTGWTGSMEAEKLGERVLIRDLYAVSSDQAILSAKIYGEDGMPSCWKIFLVSDRARKLQLLAEFDCSGETAADRESSVVVGNFSVAKGLTALMGKIAFPVWKDGQVSVYRINADAVPVVCNLQYTIECTSMTKGMVLEDGRLAVADSNERIRFYSDIGVAEYELQLEEKVSEFYPGSSGFYYLSDIGKTVNLIRENNDEYYLLQKKEVDPTLPLAVRKGGGVLYVKDGRLYLDEGLVTDMSEMLYGPVWMSALLIAVGVVITLLISGVITVLVFRKSQRSFLGKTVFWILLVFLIMSLAAWRLLPGRLTERLTGIATKNVEISAGLGLRFSADMDEQALEENHPADRVWKALADSGLYSSTVTLYRYGTAGYQVLDSTDSALYAGMTTTGSELMLKAPVSGTISEKKDSLDGTICSAVSTDGVYVFQIDTNLTYAALLEGGIGNQIFTSYTLLMILIVLLALGVLFGVWLSVIRIRNGVFQITAGDMGVIISNPTGDELEELAMAINNLTAAVRKKRDEYLTATGNYSRFLPGGLLSMLPGEGIEALNLETYAEQELIFVAAGITCSKETEKFKVTSATMREMDYFLDRVSNIIQQHGARIAEVNVDRLLFCFRKDETEKAYNAAVAILEMTDALNRKMAEEGKKMALEIRIAMDRGIARIGIVGCEEEMHPVLFSPSRLRLNSLEEISTRLDSRLLVSEKVPKDWEPEYFRYVGTAVLEQEPESIFESFKADPYLLSRRKRETRTEFENGMTAFYERNFKSAKAAFLALVRQGSGQDGPVRFYLNMSDRFDEKEPEVMDLNSSEFR